MADIYTYQPSEVVTMAGGIALSDFAEDSFIKIIPVEKDLYKEHVSSDGITSRTKSTNKNFTAELVFKQGSRSAKYLYGLSRLPNGGDIFPFIVSDPASEDEFINATQAYVKNRPEGARGKELGTVTITLTLINPNGLFI